MARPDDPATASRARQVPPHSEEAERGLLGSMMVDAARAIDLSLERRISAESFYIPAHRTIFEAILDLHEKGRPVDLLTVGQRLRDQDKLNLIGGVSYIEGLIDSTPTSAALEYYIEIVRQKHILRRIIETSNEAIEACYRLGDENADVLLDDFSQKLFDISHYQARSVIPWSEAIKETMVHIEHIFETKTGVTGIPTGFVDIDRITGGFQPADMIVIAARPSMGKTSLAMNIAEYVAMGEVCDHQPRPVAIFSLEMPRQALAKRMLCSRAGISSHRLLKGILPADEHQRLVHAAADLQKARLFVDDTANLEVVELRARARRLKKQYDIQLVVVDYLQMLNYTQKSGEGRQRETAAISAALKSMAKELNVPVVVLSQLSRAPETRDKIAVPKLSDLRDSGSIEQDADVVMLLRRPCKYPSDPEASDKTLAIVDFAKHRNGPTGEIRLNFFEETTRFANRLQTDTAAGEFRPSSGEF
ncbi:MAG: replicative DNA helicase [Kiritimatiellae bacterium]|nr:replicative DNA helicase [Kiritimatiellia bacterium]MDW8457632.1 replicative DNA helicase [Verrucomicrobiota bacterium]